MASTGDSLQDAFPAVLLIAHDNKVQLFKTTAEAQRFVEMIKDNDEAPVCEFGHSKF